MAALTKEAVRMYYNEFMKETGLKVWHLPGIGSHYIYLKDGRIRYNHEGKEVYNLDEHFENYQLFD